MIYSSANKKIMREALRSTNLQQQPDTTEEQVPDQSTDQRPDETEQLETVVQGMSEEHELNDLVCLENITNT